MIRSKGHQGRLLGCRIATATTIRTAARDMFSESVAVKTLFYNRLRPEGIVKCDSCAFLVIDHILIIS